MATSALPPPHRTRNTYDLAVLGLGGMGSAVLAHGSARGRAIGIERFRRGHDLGSSSGRSRIIRKAYFEDPHYVPLLQRTYALWRDLERTTGMSLMNVTGVLAVGPHDSTVMRATSATARAYDLPLEELDAAAIAQRFHGTAPRPGEIGLLEREAGIVFPEAAIEAHLRVAESNGAEMLFGTAVEDYTLSGTGVALRLADGAEVRAARLVVCAGPWLALVAGDLNLPLRVQRNVQLWFQASTTAYAADRFPAFLVDRPELPAPLYGFPDLGDGVKAAFHGYGESTAPDALDRAIHATDVEPVRAALEDWMPGAAAAFAFGKACMYTLTPDEHFLIDRHPHDARVVIAGGFSGHGFKFAPVIGEIAAQLAFEGGTTHPIEFLRIGRFAETAR